VSHLRYRKNPGELEQMPLSIEQMAKVMELCQGSQMGTRVARTLGNMPIPSMATRRQNGSLETLG
jgi:hypothetical protein